MALFSSPICSDAQLLDKISKGLGKVNKTLDKVNSALSGKTDKSSKNKATENKEKTSAASIDESGWKTAVPQYKYPYVSNNTKFLSANPHDICNVHDNVFAIRRNGLYEFWTINGRKLFNNDWSMANYDANYPIFSDGVVAMNIKKSVGYNNTINCLLYADGSVKELDPAWKNVSQFMDGLAIVEQPNSNPVHFFINIKGEKVFPHLSRIDDKIRPLRCGLRAVSSMVQENANVRYLWGFINESGHVVLPFKYAEVKDFSDGYAWVRPEVGGSPFNISNWMLIDKTGRVVLQTDETSCKMSNVCNGIYGKIVGHNIHYFDLNGKDLFQTEEGTQFYDGYAFVKKPSSDIFNLTVNVVDTDFKVVKQFSDKVYNSGQIQSNDTPFGEYGLASTNDCVLNPKGDVVISDIDKIKGSYSYIGGFKQFTKCGYALVSNIRLGNQQFSGIMNTDGELLWLFGNSQLTRDNQIYLPDNPDTLGFNDPHPLPPPPPYPEPYPPVIDKNMKPIGPKNVETIKYKLTVKAEPEEGGTVRLSSPSPCEYAQSVTVSASPNKDWAVSYVSTDNNKKVEIGKPFSVFEDANITVHFIKKEDEKEPPYTGAFQGRMTYSEDVTIDVDVYARISQKPDISSPYGDNTYGYFTVMFNPDKRYVTKKQDVAVNFFFTPMRISAYQCNEATGERWMVLDGGGLSLGNIKLSPSCSPLMGLWMNTILAMNGKESVTVSTRRYRIQMIDFDEKTGEFTCGRLQVFSPTGGGWVDGQDKSVHKTSKGLMMSMTDKGLPPDFLQNVRMQAAKDRNDVMWYPTASWYDNNESKLVDVISIMNSAYNGLLTDYEKMFNTK
ncbi:MAG: WG repeat-containing protein [Prevotella sp.]